MAGTPQATEIPEGLGPYEVWNFGPGSHYVFSSPQKSTRFLTALADLKPAKAGAKTRPPAGASVRIWLPTLWKGQKRTKKRKGRRAKLAPFLLKHIPFIVQKPPSVGDTKVDPKKLCELLVGGLRQKNVKPYLKHVDIEHSRFRVGLPMAKAAMKPLKTLEPVDPDWEADPELLASIKADQEQAKERSRAKKRSTEPKKQITIFAVIDDGLAFAHRNFRDASGKRTRVEFCWLQSATADKRQKSVLFGREYLRTDIEGLIRDYGNDEDTLYREAGATDDTEGLASMIERHATHGAHVMDLATGYAPERGEQPAEEIRIIGVQLPNVVTMDTSGVGKDMYLLSAFHYIFHRADLIADKYGIDRPRLVINFSYGYFGGPHDGQFDIEAAISELIQKRRRARGPTAIVLPAGNSFLDRMHASIPDKQFNGEGEVRLQWRLQPTDRTPNFLEIWFPKKYEPIGYTIRVIDSGKIERGSLTVAVKGTKTDRFVPLQNDRGQQAGQLSVDEHNGRWRVLVVTAPSEPENPTYPAIRPGAWTIVFEREPNAPRLGRESIRCWIQRDTDPTSLRSGARQSFFDDLGDRRYKGDGSLSEEDTGKALVRRFGSLSGLATASHVLAVAGFRLVAPSYSPEQAQPSSYSCAGTQNAGWPPTKIACSSMSDRSKALPGTIAAGTRSGSRSVLQGTSVAAPFVARQLATAFVSASDATVTSAEKGNYLKLLRGASPTPRGRSRKNRHTRRKDRLGAVLVPPHRQPGMEK